MPSKCWSAPGTSMSSAIRREKSKRWTSYWQPLQRLFAAHTHAFVRGMKSAEALALG
jgi:hypothetical protein